MYGSSWCVTIYCIHVTNVFDRWRAMRCARGCAAAWPTGRSFLSRLSTHTAIPSRLFQAPIHSIPICSYNVVLILVAVTERDTMAPIQAHPQPPPATRPNVPPDRTIAFAISIVRSKPEGLSIQGNTSLSCAIRTAH
jgi:hypothetical protein